MFHASDSDGAGTMCLWAVLHRVKLTSLREDDTGTDGSGFGSKHSGSNGMVAGGVEALNAFAACARVVLCSAKRGLSARRVAVRLEQVSLLTAPQIYALMTSWRDIEVAKAVLLQPLRGRVQ